MPLRKCSVVGLGGRIGAYASARVARSPRETGHWVPYPPFTVVAGDDRDGVARAVRAALAGGIEDPPLPKAPAVKEAYAGFLAALGAASVQAMMADATVGDVLDDGRRLRFLVMRRVPGGFQVDPAAHFDLPLDADDAALAAAVVRQLAPR